MALLFSQVTLSNEYYGTTEFFVSGYPQDVDDLQGWCAFDDYVDEVEDSCSIDVHVEAYLYGEGETVTATPEEVAYMMMRINWDPEFLGDHCDNIGDRDFVIDWDGDEVFGYDWPRDGQKQQGEDMNYRQMEELARRYKELYKPGDRIMLECMGDDPRPIPPGTRGTVRVVDDMGTVHCDFDNGRRLGLVPGEDSFRKLTQDELMDEQSAMKQELFIKKVNEEVIPCIEWIGMKKAYQRGDMEVPTDLLRMLHEKFLEVYETDHIEPSDGFLTVPGVVQAADGKLYPALLDVDAASSGEHYGTTFFTPKGVLCDQAGIPEIKDEIKKLIPYNYWYTVHMERDHHVDWNYCPNEAIDMLEEAVDRCQTEGTDLQ